MIHVITMCSLFPCLLFFAGRGQARRKDAASAKSEGGSDNHCQQGEWTTLAAIVSVIFPETMTTNIGEVGCNHDQSLHSNKNKSSMSVVALASGTKCVTGKNSKAQNIITDCHAEALVKRAFKRHLIEKIKEKEMESIQKAKYYLFISQLPCGTVSRFEGEKEEETFTTNACRRKPGKGEPFHKSSCVDKLCKWIHIGIQGKSLCKHFSAPIHLNGIIVGNCVDKKEFDEQVLRKRLSLSFEDEECPNKKQKVTDIPDRSQNIDIGFDESFVKEELTRRSEKRPCPISNVCWTDGRGKLFKEVTVEGRKQGTNLKTHCKNCLQISNKCINEEIEKLIVSSANSYDNSLLTSYEEGWKSLLSTGRFTGWNQHNHPHM